MEWQAFYELRVGDRVKVKVATRNGWVRGWRIVRAAANKGYIEVRAQGTPGFLVKPHEVLEHEAKEDRA